MSRETERSSVLQVQEELEPRSVNKVPFVELYNGRLQGVVSSKSSKTRVYVSFFEAGSTNFYCSTNNNRPCGGLGRSYPCKHLKRLVNEAVERYGAEKVARFLKLSVDPGAVNNDRDILSHIKGSKQKEEAGATFSRFLNYLRFVELDGSNQPIPEMGWFVSG